MNNKYQIQIPPENLYLSINSKVVGPMKIEDIREKFQLLEITRATFLWFAGLENWITVGDIPEFDRRIRGDSLVPAFPPRPSDFTVTLKGKVIPLKTEAIKALIDLKEFRRADLVFIGQTDTWVRADQHPHIRMLFQSPAPPQVSMFRIR